MNRRRFLLTSSFAVAAGELRTVPLFGQQQTPVSTRFQELRSGVGIFIGRGGTIGYYASPDALIAVDSQFADTAKEFLAGLKQRSSRIIDVLINTHHHGDHTSGNAVLRPATRAIVAHQNVPKLQKAQAEAAGNAAGQVYADTTFAATWRQQFGKEAVRVRYRAAAHTGGDSVVFFEEANVAHMGDLMFNHRHPRIDRPGGGSVRSWITVLEDTVRNFGTQTLYIFGHAADGFELTGSQKEVLFFRDYLSKVVEQVGKGVKAGQSKAEITKPTTLPGFEKFAGSGNLTLTQVLGVTYDELTAVT